MRSIRVFAKIRAIPIMNPLSWFMIIVPFHIWNNQSVFYALPCEYIMVLKTFFFLNFMMSIMSIPCRNSLYSHAKSFVIKMFVYFSMIHINDCSIRVV